MSAPRDADGDNGIGWGPWVRHNGRGCPLPTGTLVEVVCEDGFGFSMRLVDRVSGDNPSSWDWRHYPKFKRITRYRVHVPRATGAAGQRAVLLTA